MDEEPECQVERCEFPATALHTLKERNGAFDWPKEVIVCDIHREQLSNPSTEWMLLNDIEGRRLLVGPMLAELNEYILEEPITTLTGHLASRDLSHREHNGYHVPLKVRRRGGSQETLTLVIPYDLLAPSANFLHRFVSNTQETPQADSE